MDDINRDTLQPKIAGFSLQVCVQEQIVTLGKSHRLSLDASAVGHFMAWVRASLGGWGARA